MDLFELNNSRAFPSVHALLIEPFKSIWEADDTKDKGNAIRLFSYVELMCSPKRSNPFFGYSETVRPLKVKKEIYKDENYPDTTYMIAGVAAYKELLANSSPSFDLLNAGLTAKDALVNFLSDSEAKLAMRTNTGGMVFKPADLTNALTKIGSITKELEAARDKVGEELKEAAKTRGQRTIGLYER
jgi:hypothetical protein